MARLDWATLGHRLCAHGFFARTVAALLLTVLSAPAEMSTDPEVPVETFFIDLYEYPNRLGQLPRVDVTFDEASRLCTERGKRLCTEREWERACRGPDHLSYGYGPTFVAGRCNTPVPDGEGNWRRDTGTQPAGTYPACGWPSGPRDMLGNVWEWTDGWYDEDHGWRVVRGGSWFHNLNFARADGRFGPGLTGEYRLDLIGFRCCRDILPGNDGP